MYNVIAISLMLAYFMGINVAASAAAAGLWALIEKPSLRWRPRSRANAAFVLRVGPPLVALSMIAAFFLPAYLIFEPIESGETISTKLAAVVALSLLASSVAVFRVAVGYLRTRQLLRNWTSRSKIVRSQGTPVPVRSLRHPVPLVAVLGVIQPRIFISASLLCELDEQEIAAAIGHEAGHIASRDNLKRIILRACSDLLLLPIGTKLDEAWRTSAEFAADEYAAAKFGRRGALDLASALIKIGKLTPPGNALPAGFRSNIVGGRVGSLADRVERLLDLADSADEIALPAVSRPTPKIALVLALISAALLPFVLGIEFLAIVHAATESLLEILS